ncbi:MAG: tripartite tricarboxylate transporter substrate-binding protein, partial [Betaproteobacteria bacterium]
QLMFNNMLSAMPQVKAGRLRALAVTSTRRSNALPELPAIAETLPGYEASGWYGLLAPAATPREAVARINSETSRIMKLPEVAQRLAGDGVEAVGTTPGQFAAYLRAEIEKWGRIVKTAGIKAD